MEVNLCNSSYSSQSFTPILKCDFLSDFLQTCVNLILWNTQVPPPQSAASGNAELAPLGFAQLRARIFHFAPRWARGGRKLSVACSWMKMTRVISFVYKRRNFFGTCHGKITNLCKFIKIKKTLQNSKFDQFSRCSSNYN